MTYATRRKTRTRHWLISDVDHLERRELLTVASVTHTTLIPFHVEVSTKTVQAESAKHATKAHTATTKHTSTLHEAKSSVKTSHTTAKHAVKAKTPSTAPKLPTMINSTLIVRKAQ